MDTVIIIVEDLTQDVIVIVSEVGVKGDPGIQGEQGPVGEVSEVELLNKIDTANFLIVTDKQNFATLGIGENIGGVLIGSYNVDGLVNRMTGDANLRTILGGYDNEVIGDGLGSGVACSIFSSQHSSIDGSTVNHAVIISGSFNIINAGAYSVICGGTGNKINGTANGGAGIFGGTLNTVSDNASLIIGGVSNIVSGNTSIDIGGISNIVSGNTSTNTGGNGNTVSGASSFNGGGTGNEVTENFSGNLGGMDNVNNAQYTTTSGRDNLINSGANYSKIIAGQNNEILANALYSSVSGRDGIAHVRGSHVFSSENITNDGDAQTFVVPLRRQTTNATPTPLRPSDFINIEVRDDTAWCFSGNVIAYDGTDSVGFKIEGVCMNNAGTLSLVGVPTITNLGSSAGAATWNMTIATVGVSLRINGVGEIGKNINWSCKFNVAESGV